MSGGCGDFRDRSGHVAGCTAGVHMAAAAGQPAPTIDYACDAWAASQAKLAASGFVRGRKPMSTSEVFKLADILAASMVEEHRQVLEKQGKLAVASFVAGTENNRQLMDRAAEAQRKLAADLNVGVEEILTSAIMSAQPQGVRPHMPSTKEDVWRFDDRPADTPQRLMMQQLIYDDPAAVEAAKAAAEAQSASPSSSGNSAHEAEVQQSTKRPKTRGAAAVDPGQENSVAATPEPPTMQQTVEDHPTEVAAAAAADAAAEPLSAAPSSASALKAEVRRLRVQLTQRDLLVDQLRGDVAALKSVKQESCTPLIQYMQGQVGVALMDTEGACGAGV